MTPAPELQQCLDLLPKMNRAELTKVCAAVKLLQNKTKGEKEPSPRDWLLEGIVAELERRGLGHPPLNGHAWISSMAPNYEADSARIREHLQTRMQGKHHYAQLVALGRVVARVLADKLENTWVWRDEAWVRLPVPVGAKRMLTSVGKVPEAVEAAFPGYLTAGLINLLIHQRVC